MDGRGGCCIARYTGGGAYNMSKVSRIMMRFRPIAPKPTSTNGSVSGGGSSSSTPENTEPSPKTGRVKRKYSKDATTANNTNKRVCNRKRKASPENTSSGGSVSGKETVVTLPLFPQTSDVKESKKRGGQSAPLWLSFGSEGRDDPAAAAAVVPHPSPRAVVGSWVKVECVTNSLSDCYRLGRTDEERLMSLQRDACPGFISDGLNRVMWTNGAYRKLVGGGSAEEVVAWLVMEAGVVVPVGVPSFTCRVRVVTCGKDKISLTLPCDVWRMHRGGFAWRLDTTAALSLGR